jgi:hypothetical protein
MRITSTGKPRLPEELRLIPRSARLASPTLARPAGSCLSATSARTFLVCGSLLRGCSLWVNRAFLPIRNESVSTSGRCRSCSHARSNRAPAHPSLRRRGLPDQLERFHSPGPGRKCARRQPLPQPTANRPVGARDGSIAAPQCRERRRIGIQILMVELKSTRVVGQSAVPENAGRRG